MARRFRRAAVFQAVQVFWDLVNGIYMLIAEHFPASEVVDLSKRGQGE